MFRLRMVIAYHFSLTDIMVGLVQYSLDRKIW